MSDDKMEEGVGRLYFQASTIETIDKSVFNYLESLNLFTTTNKGWKKVPVVWATSERSYLSKKDKDLRDNLGTLVFPVISIRRAGIKKELKSPGVYQGNLPEHIDEQGGALNVNRVVYQEKSTKFANADSYRLNGQTNYPRQNSKVVFRTVTAPMPVNIEVMYEITLRTEYQQQINELMLPFITKPGTINFVRLSEGIHKFEGFVQPNYQSQDNLNDYSSQERKFETKINLKVVGYLIGQADNRDKPHFAIRENAVEVKIPRERISLQEVPEHEYGQYYGLSGVPAFEVLSRAPFASFFSNVPAISGKPAAGAGTSTEGITGNIITSTNLADGISQNFVIREVLKNAGSDSLVGDTVITITGGPTSANVKENTESVYLNGMILAVGAENDYTISGNVITLADEFALEESDSLYVTYIVSV